jgi:hypothetical protein
MLVALQFGMHQHDLHWRSRVDQRPGWLNEEVRHPDWRWRQTVPAYLRHASVSNLLTTPIVYSLALPFVLLDLWVTTYQWICFPVYCVARVRRRSYFVIDRHKLAYLNAIEKANCMYCSYATGVIGYVREVAARTEQYWCPIRHARGIPAPHGHYQRFFDYGDAAGYHERLPAVRRSLRRARSGARRTTART